MDTDETHSRTLSVIYATQTGWARDIAERVCREGRCRRIDMRLMNIREVTLDLLCSLPLVIIVTSTTGQGDLPDDAQPLWKQLLRKQLTARMLAGVRHAIFGLGDSSYTLFNAAARKMERRLTQLGSESFCPRGEGDDQHRYGQEGGLQPWLDELWLAVDRLMPLPPGVELLDPASMLTLSYEVETLAADGESSGDGVTALTDGRAWPARVLFNQRLTSPQNAQDVRHIGLDIGGSGIAYEPGDVAYVVAENSPAAVDWLLGRCGLDGEARVRVRARAGTAASLAPAMQNSCTVRTLLACALDLGASPRRHGFALLATCAAAPVEARRLEELASLAGLEDLHAYALRDRRTLAEVLTDFPSTRPSLAMLLELVPHLTPRAYSICSAQRCAPDRLELAVAVVCYRKGIREPRRGVASHWLASKSAGDVVPVFVRRGTLAFPTDPRVPCILIGPGTGIAPLRAWLLDALARHGDGPFERALALVVCGHRSASGDFLFGDEWRSLADRGAIVLWTAFSRDGPNKVYVQDLLAGTAEARETIWSLLNDAGACVFVAGNAKKMPAAVRAAFRTVLMHHAGTDAEGAELMLRSLDRTKRYQTETWS